MAYWVHDGNQVYGAAAPLVWNTLDLKVKFGGGSTSHPTAKTLALLRIENTAGAAYMAFRAGGSAVDSYLAAGNAKGAALCRPDNSPDLCMVLVPTSATGTIEWQSQVANNTEIYLIGFVEVVDSLQEIYALAGLPAVWTDLDATTDTGAASTGLTGEALAFLWYLKNGGAGSNWFAVRPNGRTDQYLGSGAPAGCSQALSNANLKSNGLVVKTDAAGLLEHVGQAVVINAAVDLDCFVQSGWVDTDVEVFAAGAPPLAWTNLSLAAHVGAVRALCLLQVHLQNVPGVAQRAGFRASDETKNLLPGSNAYPMGVSFCVQDQDDATLVLVETGPTGIIQWQANAAGRNVDLRLLGYIAANPPPTIYDETPTGSDESAEVVVGFDCADDTSVDPLTIDLDLTDPSLVVHNAIIDGIFQPGYNGSIIPNGSNGYEVRLSGHPQFDVGAWQADAYVEDGAGAGASLNWSFTVGSMAIVTGYQSRLNAVDIEFDEIPRELDPSDPTDARYLANYTLTGPVTPVRLVQDVEYVGNNILRIYYDGNLIAGTLYEVGISGILSTTGHPLSPSPSTVSFVAFDEKTVPTPLLGQTLRYDIRNPQTPKDAPQNAPLGTFVVNSGNLDIETARAYLRKRIWRRLGTARGAFFHLPNYGLKVDEKTLATPTKLRRLKTDIEEQIKDERDVVGVSASVSTLADGVYYVKLVVSDKFGVFESEGTIEGE